MNASFSGWVATTHPLVLLALLALSFVGLCKGAELLVGAAVRLSLRWRIPKILIGATVVSIGTTLPEASVSVAAAVMGHPEMALGNAVGSILCNTGLIMGLAILLGRIPVDRRLVKRQGTVQLLAALALVLLSLPWLRPGGLFSGGGGLPRVAGVLLLAALGGYLWLSLVWARSGLVPADTASCVDQDAAPGSAAVPLLLLAFGALLVIVSSHVLIHAAQSLAHRMRVPQAVIAVSLVALGTSLPEMVTALTAIRRGHGELALGNILGADILNVFFVAGSAIAVTPGGLAVPRKFIVFYYPAMLLLLLVFRFSIIRSGTVLKKRYGLMLCVVYLFIMAWGYQ